MPGFVPRCVRWTDTEQWSEDGIDIDHAASSNASLSCLTVHGSGTYTVAFESAVPMSSALPGIHRAQRGKEDLYTRVAGGGPLFLGGVITFILIACCSCTYAAASRHRRSRRKRSIMQFKEEELDDMEENLDSQFLNIRTHSLNIALPTYNDNEGFFPCAEGNTVEQQGFFVEESEDSEEELQAGVHAAVIAPAEAPAESKAELQVHLRAADAGRPVRGCLPTSRLRRLAQDDEVSDVPTEDMAEMAFASAPALSMDVECGYPNAEYKESADEAPSGSVLSPTESEWAPEDEAGVVEMHDPSPCGAVEHASGVLRVLG
mmetsp:Transcript_26010/g.80806  ORF Transcript_26010/g.80806 Transcript_26010/m.80806 type:complete len:318 (-) Transcript_26010:121-1074(-)